MCLCLWQLWLRMAVMSFFTLCLVLLWLVGPGWCTSIEFSWLGLMPMQVRLLLCFSNRHVTTCQEALVVVAACIRTC